MLLLIAAIGPAGSEVRATLARTHLPSAGSKAKATLARSKPTPYARDGGSNVSAPRQHYLQVDRHWTPYSKATTLSWFDRVSILEKGVDVITCGIEKNGITLLTRIIAEVLGQEFKWYPSNPSMVGLSLEAFKDRLGDASSSWRKLVVYRDPMERFLSAYRSKCLLAEGDRDGRKHCHNLFRLNDSQISVLNVASRLPQYGHHNPHWATQTSFCGGTVGSPCGRATRTTCPSTTSLASQTLSKGGCLRRPSRGYALSCNPRLRESILPTPKSTFKRIWAHQLCVGCCMTSIRMITASSALKACSLLNDILLRCNCVLS